MKTKRLSQKQLSKVSQDIKTLLSEFSDAFVGTVYVTAELILSLLAAKRQHKKQEGG